MLKYIISILSAMALIITISACGGGGGSSSTTNSENSSNDISPSYDGSQSSPVALQVGSSFSGKVGTGEENYTSYYSLSVTDSDTYTFSVNNLSPSADVEIAIYDVNGEILDGAYGESKTEESLSYYLEANQYYYVLILNVETYATTYQLTISATSEADNGPTAIELIHNQVYSGYVDADSEGNYKSYYGFASDYPGIYRITVNNIDPQTNLDIAVFKENVFLDQTNDTSTTSDVLYFSSDGTETFFIVVGSIAESYATYDIVVNQVE
jgi:hypothetical protein